jgi:hypothetical protein
MALDSVYGNAWFRNRILAINVGLATGIITKTNLLNKQNQLNLFCL